MSSNTSSITRLLSVANEPEAAAIVAALADRGIVARYVGGYTAGFLAEAPGRVDVLVRQEDLARASDVVEEHSSSVAEIDWSTVDCGDSRPLSEDEQSDTAIADIKPRPLQVSLKTLLVVQSVFCILLGFLQTPFAGFFFMTLIVVAIYVFIAVGTVEIISKQERASERLRYLASSLILLGILLFAMLLFRMILEIG